MKNWTWYIVLALLIGCASMERDCSSGCASSTGADWVVLQYGHDGTPINCWKLRKAAITNEKDSDGIYWLDTESKHLVHISGWYNRVQVESRDFESAARLLGVEAAKCKNGRYAETP